MNRKKTRPTAPISARKPVVRAFIYSLLLADSIGKASLQFRCRASRVQYTSGCQGRRGSGKPRVRQAAQAAGFSEQKAPLDRGRRPGGLFGGPRSAGPGGPAVAVGTVVARCPPHRPVLALLTHTVPASDTDVWRQSARWPLRAHAPAHVTHRSGTVSGTG